MNSDQIVAISFSGLALGMDLLTNLWLFGNGATCLAAFAALGLGAISASLSIYAVVERDRFIAVLVSEILLKFLVPIIDLLNTLALIKILARFFVNLGQTEYNPANSRKWIRIIHFLFQTVSILIFIFVYSTTSNHLDIYALVFTAIVFLIHSIFTLIISILFFILLFLLPAGGPLDLSICKSLLFWTILLELISIGTIINHIISSSPTSSSALTTTTILKTLWVVQVCLHLPIPIPKPTEEKLTKRSSRLPGMSYFTSQLDVNLSIDGLSFFGSQHTSTRFSTSKLSFLDRRSKRVVKSDIPPVPSGHFGDFNVNGQGDIPPVPKLDLDGISKVSKSVLKNEVQPVLKEVDGGIVIDKTPKPPPLSDKKISIAPNLSIKTKGVETGLVVETRMMECASPQTPRNADLSPT